MMLSTRCSSSERRLDAVGMGQFQGTIHLVGRDMIETLALIPLRQAFPVELGSLQEAQSTHHVGLGKGEGVFDAAVYMALSSQMDDAIHLLVLHQLVESIEVADIHLHKLVVRFVLNVFQISQITGIGQLVEVDNVVVGILVHK